MPMTPEQPNKKRLVFPFYANILTIFLLVVLAIAGGLTYYNYRSSYQRTIFSAQELMKDIVRRVNYQGQLLIGTAWNVIQLCAESPLVGVSPAKSNQPLLDYFLRALDEYPHFYGLFIGYDNGEFFQVVRLAGISVKGRKKIRAPAGALYGIRTVMADLSSVRTMTWTFLDPSRKPIASWSTNRDVYDPRVRPWFKVAVKPGISQRTNFYFFDEMREVGLSVVQRFSFKRYNNQNRDIV